MKRSIGKLRTFIILSDISLGCFYACEAKPKYSLVIKGHHREPAVRLPRCDYFLRHHNFEMKRKQEKTVNCRQASCRNSLWHVNRRDEVKNLGLFS